MVSVPLQSTQGHYGWHCVGTLENMCYTEINYRDPQRGKGVYFLFLGTNTETVGSQETIDPDKLQGSFLYYMAVKQRKQSKDFNGKIDSVMPQSR